MITKTFKTQLGDTINVDIGQPGGIIINGVGETLLFSYEEAKQLGTYILENIESPVKLFDTPQP